MARIVQLFGAPSSDIEALLPHRYCIGLFTDEDLTAARQIALHNGGIVVEDMTVQFRGQKEGVALKGIVVLAAHSAGYLFSTCMDALRAMCNTIDAFSEKLKTARFKKQEDPKPPAWMLIPRTAYRGVIPRRYSSRHLIYNN